MTPRQYPILRLTCIALISLLFGCVPENKGYNLECGKYESVVDDHINLFGYYYNDDVPNIYGDTLFLFEDSTFVRKKTDRYLIKGDFYRHKDSLFLNCHSTYISFFDSIDLTEYTLFLKINGDNSLYGNSTLCEDGSKVEQRLKLVSSD